MEIRPPKEETHPQMQNYLSVSRSDYYYRADPVGSRTPIREWVHTGKAADRDMPSAKNHSYAYGEQVGNPKLTASHGLVV